MCKDQEGKKTTEKKTALNICNFESQKESCVENAMDLNTENKEVTTRALRH